MRLAQIITDYIRRSILTTVGDLVVRGAGGPERLAAGALKTFLAGQGVGTIPAWEGHKLSDHRMASGSFTRNTAGNEVVTGLTFRPSLLFFLTRCDETTERNWSIGIDNISVRMSLISYRANAMISNNTTVSIYIEKAINNRIVGTVTAFSDDGFTTTFTLLGVSCALVAWLAIE